VPNITRFDVDLTAYDTTDDHVENYDSFFIEYSGRETPLDAQRWFAVSANTAEGLYGSWSKVMKIDPALANVTIYWGAIARNHGEPQFTREVDDKIGFWPSTPDEECVRAAIAGHPGIDAETFTQQSDRLADHLARVTRYAIATRDFDLLLAY